MSGDKRLKIKLSRALFKDVLEVRQWVHRQVTNKHIQKVLSGQTEVRSS